MRLKLAGALVAALLVFGMVFGVGQAAAASLPGGPLYGLKLTAEDARMALTSDPEAKAELAAEFAESRLDEIGRMMAAGKAVDGETAHAAQQQVSQAYQYMNQVEGEGQGKVAQHLATMLQSRNRVMEDEIKGVPRQQQEPVRTLLRSMELVQVRVNEGQGSTNRLGEGDPQQAGPAGEPGASGAKTGQQDDDGLLDASGDTGQGGQGQGAMGPSDGETPGQGPAGQQSGDEVDPDQNQYGPSGPQGGYEGDGPSYGPDSTAPTKGPEATFSWLWNLFRSNPESSGSSSGSGSSGSGSSGSSSSGSGSSGSGSSGRQH